MEKALEQNILKYERIQNVSYGSTSYVYKIRKRQVEQKSLNKGQIVNSKFEQFPMAHFDNDENERNNDDMD